jgi:hypothetical protein
MVRRPVLRMIEPGPMTKCSSHYEAQEFGQLSLKTVESKNGSKWGTVTGTFDGFKAKQCPKLFGPQGVKVKGGQ